MTKRIDCLLPLESDYGTTYSMMGEICGAFSRQGFDTRLVPKEDLLEVTINDPPNLTFSFNKPPFTKDQEYIYNVTKIPHFSYLIDPPYRFSKLFDSHLVYVGCDDSYYLEFLNDIKFKKACFFPHGADKNLAPNPNVERDIDVLISASYTDFEYLRKCWYEIMPDVMSLTMDDTAEITLSDSHTSFMQAFLEAYQKRMNIKRLRSEIFYDFSLPLVLVERYIKGKERVDLVKSIKDATVHIYGKPAVGEVGWENILDGNNTNLIIHEPVNYFESLELMKRAKIVLNPFSRSKGGGHDRLFNALACGALILTNENPYLQQYFTDEENILFYRPYELEKVNDKINKFLKDEELRKHVAEAGRQEVMTRHTWDHRIETLSEVWNELLS